jgi:hypothetical protein
MFEEESGAMVGEKTHSLQRVKAGENNQEDHRADSFCELIARKWKGRL